MDKKNPFNFLIERAKPLNGKTLVFPEGEDERVANAIKMIILFLVIVIAIATEYLSIEYNKGVIELYEFNKCYCFADDACYKYEKDTTDATKVNEYVYAETDNDSVVFYQKNDFSITEFYETYDGETVVRYKCELIK